MVDVWQELGRAVGRALKPLADMGAAIWKGFGDAASDIIEGLMAGAEGLKDTVEPTVSGLLPGVFDEASLALGEDSPPKEIKESVDKFIEQLMGTIEKQAKTEGKSLPTGEELAKTQATLVATIIGMYAATHAISIALDATQPIKDWGFKTAIMDMLYQFNMRDVIGPMIQAPIWASVVMPMRMRARAANPYEVPGTGVLPYLRAKDIITDVDYKLNMKYSAYDETWSDRMLDNTWRYPGFGDMRTMIHRGVATWEEAKVTLEKNLVATEYIDAYEALLPAIPGSGDLITMMVREVIEKEDFIKNMELQGWSREWADLYFDNHWVLLPLGEVKKARHRGDIDDGELDKYLVLHDYKPEARPGIKTSDQDLASGLIWDLPGRIESRWMFRWGEVDVTDLRDALVKDGLDPAYADQVARAVAKNQFLSDINRQVANIKGDYARGYSVEATLRADLTVLGLRSEMVEYHVVDALEDRKRSIHDEELRTLRAQYARGAKTMADVIGAVEPIIVDVVARDAWLAALPTAKQVVIMEETYGTEVNRLVANAKYDYVRGYTTKPNMVSRFTLLDLPVEVIEFHVMDADEDRARGHKDKSLAIIEEGYVDDVITWEDVEAMARPILVDEEAYNIWLDGVWLNKHKAVRVFAGE